MVKNRRSLQETHPELFKDLHPVKNGDLTSLKRIHNGYHRNLIWVCEKGHEWNCSPIRRVSGASCYYCSGKKILAGFNDIFTLYPEIKELWDYNRNNFDPNTTGTGKTFYAICPKGHDNWKTNAHNIVIRKRKCPYCSNKRILQGYNDLATTHPELAARVHEDSDFKATEVSAGSNKTLLWNCLKDKRHVFEAYPYRLTGSSKRDCTICAGKVVVDGVNDFKSYYPDLVKKWDYSKNTLSPNEISYGSNRKVWWIGKECRHSFEKSPKRMAKETGCPYCSLTNAKFLKGHNDLYSQYPDIAAEWSSRNILKPDEIHYGTQKKYWWVCKEDSQHEWEATPENRVRANSGCPHCWREKIISKAEQEIYDYIVNLLPKCTIVDQSNRSIISPYELDIYIPEKKIAIEYNGLYWHTEGQGKDKRYHYNKWKQCQDKGIQLITVWEDDYLRKPEPIKQMLLHKLGASTVSKVPARKTTVVNVSSQVARKIYEDNHIQGHKDGFHLGLQDKITKEIIAVSTWTRTPSTSTVRLERFATSKIVQGGFSKLLKHASTVFSAEGFDRIITFADHQVSTGKLYEHNGFIADKNLEPDYSYLYNGERHHKFGFRLKRFRNDPDLKFKENMTERELAVLNGIERIWDCGKTRYVLGLKTS